MKARGYSSTTEVQLIRQIRQVAEQRPLPVSRLKLSIGDDAAAFQNRPGFLTLISCDALVEGVHFDLEYFLPEDLGWKALAVNLSDIAAMGGTPLYFTTSVALPEAGNLGFIQRLYRGMKELAEATGVRLIGGDTCFSGHGVFLDITIIGEVEGPKLLKRSGARPGDLLFVSGELGGSAIGLEFLRLHGRRRKSLSVLARRHLRPIPRLEIGRFLSPRRLASALIDVSDGLSTDLSHLCESSGVGAVIDAAKLPVVKVGKRLAAGLPKPLLHYALHGGEDYELLFTVPASQGRRIPSQVGGVSIHEIGIITRDVGLCWIQDGKKSFRLRPQGFDHFAGC